MRKNKTSAIGFLVLILLFIALSCVTVPEDAEPRNTPSAASNADVVVDVQLLTAVAPAIYMQFHNMEGFTEKSGFICFGIGNHGSKPVRLSVESVIQGYSEKAVNTVDIEPGASKGFGQTPVLKPEALRREIANATVYYRVADSSGAVIKEETLPVKIYAKDTMLWTMSYSNGETSDATYFIASFVTPHAQEVDDLVRRAANYHPGGSMQGYQCSGCSDAKWKEYTMAQVKAIYQALQQDYKLKYISSTIAYSNKSDVPQRVRLPSESLRTGSANCIDGAVLYASALESLNLEPSIMILPTHAFLAYLTKPGDYTSIVGLETTMTAWATFEEATQRGNEELRDEFKDGGNIDSGASMMCPIKIIRKSSGFLPME